jgi:CheY-like chemotaxis protein/two-component sensor histidine kinase
VPVEFKFEKMLQKALAIIQYHADERRQTLTVNVDENVPRFVIGDDNRLLQVIINLLSNAVKFTPDGGEIYLGVSLDGEPGGGYCELRIEVKDNGIGISPEQQERLFSAFEQAESGISREYGGTGLGLSISKRIIEFMGGRIWIESELGKGARFIFTVKVMRGQGNDEAGYSEAGGANESEEMRSGEFEGKRLLIAEDVEINREIILELLKDSGLGIDCVENGKDALDMVSDNPGKYDIVFMDLQMPHMDGLDATRHIRAVLHGRREKLPIIAMTANVFQEDIETCLAAGMDGHLGKPLDICEVAKILRRFLAQ